MTVQTTLFRIPLAFPYTSFLGFWFVFVCFFFLSEFSFSNNKRQPFQLFFFLHLIFSGKDYIEAVCPQKWKPTQMQTV